MPDKERFMSEITRLLKQGGRVVTATWNLRDMRTVPLTSAESKHIQFFDR